MQEALQENLLRHDDHPGRSSAMVAAEDKSLRSSDGNKSPDDGQASGQTEYQPRQSYVADLRQALADGKSPILDMDTMTWRSFLEQTLAKFSALLSAAVCYVAAIAWILVAYGEMGLDPSEERPVRGWDLVSFFCALVCVTASCFVGVYKLQKMKYRAVAREVDHMNTLLLRPEGKNDDDGQASGPKPPADLLQASIPSFRQTHDIEGAIYKELVVRKLRAEGVQKGSNLITDAWTFANMKMMTIFLRSCFVSSANDTPGTRDLGKIWIYTTSVFALCMLLVAAAWEYPPRFIANSKKGFSTDRRARVELVAKSWSGGCAWLVAMQLIDAFEFTCAQLTGHTWHPWSSTEGTVPMYSRGTSLSTAVLWALSFCVFLLMGTALVVLDRLDRRKRRRLEDEPSQTTPDRELSSGPIRGGGCCCLCSLLRKRADKLLEFICATLLWTGALALKRTIDETAGLHGGIWRNGKLIPPPADRVALGFVYAASMLLAALFVGMLIDLRVHYLLNSALAAAEQPDRQRRGEASRLRMRYEFGRRLGSMLSDKCLAYTSCAQTSTAVVVALKSFPSEHYWMYAFASTTVGVLVSLLLANQCTLGRGAPTCSDCQRALRLLCCDDCGCGRRGRQQTALLDPTPPSAAPPVPPAPACDPAESLRPPDARLSTRVVLTDAPTVCVAAEGGEAAAGTVPGTVYLALVQQLDAKERECASMAARLAVLEKGGVHASAIGGSE